MIKELCGIIPDGDAAKRECDKVIILILMIMMNRMTRMMMMMTMMMVTMLMIKS